jgi:hypothetical protein
MLARSWVAAFILILTSKVRKVRVAINRSEAGVYVYIPESAELSCCARRSKVDMTAVLKCLLAGRWVTHSTYPHFPGPRVLSRFAEPHFDGG